MGKSDGEPHSDAGQDCPAFRKLQGNEKPDGQRPEVGDQKQPPHPGPMTRSRPLARPDGPSTGQIPSTASQAVEVPQGRRGSEIIGQDLRFVLATDEEGAAITQCLKERAESAPAGARIGRASALARTGLRFAAIVLLAAGVGVGLGDGDLFDNVGCSVAQQPRRVSHGADSGQAGEHPDGKVPGSGKWMDVPVEVVGPPPPP